ncbi:MAG: HEPN domain-containing protein [Dehalococcoidia bacterium]
MVSFGEVIERTRPMMELAESVDPKTPGAAGLAYQAAELAVHILLMEIDGTDPWDDEKRYRRMREVLGVDEEQHDLAFMHKVRLRDFYANATRITTDYGPAFGPPLEVPDADDCRRCVAMARRIVDAVQAKVEDLRPERP